MSEKSVHLASRLAEILQKLNSGVTISVKDLALEFGVSERTIQKDINQRLDPSLIESLGSGLYKLIPGLLGNITQQDIIEFSELSGIIDLYPDLDDVIRKKIRDSLIVKSSVNKGCLPTAHDFKEISYTISNSLKLKFSYYDNNIVVEPYKLLNQNGIWYLLALNNFTIKSYCVHKMKKVRRDVNNFVTDETLLRQIIDNPSPWFRENKVEVILEVVPEFVSYFTDRNLIPNIKSKTSTEDNSLIIEFDVNSIDEIKGLIKFWLPKIRVIEPIELKNEIIDEINIFLNL